MTEGLENTRSENNQVSPPPLPCSVALRGVSVFIREYRENAYETRGLTLTAKNLMKSFQPFSSETIVSSVSPLYCWRNTGEKFKIYPYAEMRNITII